MLTIKKCFQKTAGAIHKQNSTTMATEAFPKHYEELSVTKQARRRSENGVKRRRRMASNGVESFFNLRWKGALFV